MNSIYVLELSEEKWYLHISKSDDINKVYMECKLISSFVRKYLPIKSYETTIIFNDYDLDTYLKKYMRNYGINNVRGGIYTELILSETENLIINNICENKLNPINKRLDMIDSIVDKYKDLDEWSKEKIEEEIRNINTNYEYYNKSKCLYNQMKQPINGNVFSYNIKKSLSWLNKMVIMNAKYILSGNAEKKKLCADYEFKQYIDVITEIKNACLIYNSYLSDSANEIKYSPIIHIRSPRIIFDEFMCHVNINTITDNFEIALKLIESIELIVYTVICRLQELEFDINSFGELYDDKVEYSLKYLNEKSQLYKNE